LPNELGKRILVKNIRCEIALKGVTQEEEALAIGDVNPERNADAFKSARLINFGDLFDEHRPARTFGERLIGMWVGFSRNAGEMFL